MITTPLSVFHTEYCGPGRWTSSPQGVQLQFGDQALLTKDKAPVGCARVIDAVLVADEAATIATQIKQLIPVGAVAYQARDIVGEEDTDLVAVDQSNQFLETSAASRDATGAAEVSVDDADTIWGPAQGVGSVHELILEFKTLLVGNGRVGGRLADIDDRQLAEITRGDARRDAHG
jgi:hypothetical protein